MHLFYLLPNDPLRGKLATSSQLEVNVKFLDIGEVAEKSGIKPSALRYYEEAGLIQSVARHGLRRQFPPEVLLQLKLIVLGKSAGFSLAQIGEMFGTNGLPDLPRAVFHEKAKAIDRQINELATLRDTLRHVADCPAPSHMECPSFKRLIKGSRGDTAGSKRTRPHQGFST